MKPKTIIYYDWSDFKELICKHMGIDRQYFNCYHKITEGGYRNLWHLWIDYLDRDCADGHICLLHNDCMDIGNTFSALYRYNPEKYPLWTKPFFDAIDKIHLEYGAEIYVKYEW